MGELRRLRAALFAACEAAYEWDFAADRIHWFDTAAELFKQRSLRGFSTGRSFNGRIHPEDLSGRVAAVAALRERTRAYDCEYRLRIGDGGIGWFHDRGVGIYGPGGALVGLRGVVRAIPEARRSDARLGWLARHDELTGLFNRPRLREALDHALDYGRRYATEGAYLAVGIDKLSMLNQACGHEVADRVILTIGARIDGSLRASDVVGRVGGDCFGVILSHCPADEIADAAERVLEIARSAAVETEAGTLHVTVSVGCVAFPGTVWTATEVMTKADIAMQRAKRDGRDCFAVYVHSESELRDYRRKIVVAEQVQGALRADRLAFAFQPIVDSGSHEPILHECLLRMRLPDGEIVAAGQFMPVVEELGMIRMIDRRAFTLAVAQLERYRDAQIALNVSGLTTIDAGWLSGAVATLRGRPELAQRLLIEITETARLEDIDACAHFVATLRDLGCLVALDDFGAGHTSFRHLKMLPVNMVKIDGYYIRDLPSNPDNLVFVRTLVGLARSFDLQTIAECVETAEEATLLAEEGVDFLQGWAFGRPSLEPPWGAAPAQHPIAATSAG